MAAKPRKTTRRREPPILSGEDELDEAIQQAAIENAEQEVEAATQKRGRGRPRKNPPPPKPAAPKADGKKVDWTDFVDPVSITFLSQVFRMDVKTVKKRIRKVDPVGSDRGNDTYDFLEAASYLVEPNIDLSDYIRGMRPQDLPQNLPLPYWAGQEKRLTVMALSRETWKTDAVSEAAVLIMKTCRETMIRLPDLSKDKLGLTDKQHEDLIGIVRGSLETMQQDVKQNALTRLLMGPESRALEDADREIEHANRPRDNEPAMTDDED